MIYNEPVPGLVIKLASLCNLKCDYCYWFKDPEVYNHPKKLTIEAEKAFVSKLKVHIEKYQLKNFEIMFHGGEPLLFGKRRFIEFLQKLEKIRHMTHCHITFSITTNGVFIDQEWADLFKIFKIMPCISIDGSKAIHDMHRVDMKGKGTFDRTVQAIHLLRQNGIKTSVISVIDPQSDPSQLLSTIVDELHFKNFDIFIPDANYEDKPQRIARFYKKLIDLWFEHYQYQDVKILFLDSMIRCVLGYQSNTQFIGLGREGSVILNTDGSLEPSDTLRRGGHDLTRTQVNIIENNLQDIFSDPTWIQIYEISYQTPEACLDCRHLQACGSGHISQRWSPINGYDNPSVYCADYQEIFDHLKNKILEQDLIR